MIDIIRELDKEVLYHCNGWRTPALDYILGWPTWLGSTIILLPLAVLLIAIFDRKSFLKKSAALFVTLLSVDGAVQMLKLVIGRERPFVLFADEPTLVSVLFHPPVSYAFPSGHASLAFAAAVFLNFLYHGRLKFLYVFAVWIALSRIYIGVHFPSDVIAGAIFGSLGAYLWSRWFAANEKKFKIFSTPL